MPKHIKLFEDFENQELKTLKSSADTNWNSIRDCVQSLKPFTILNFKHRGGYLDYIENCNKEFTKQTYHTHNGEREFKCPSLFINGGVPIQKEDFKRYGLINCITGKNDDSNVIVKTESESNTIGNEIVSTLSQDDVRDDNHYKVGSVFYKFINFMS